MKKVVKKKVPTKKPQPAVKQGTSKEAAAARKAIFVEAYIANGRNATEAAKTAGYSIRTARSQGCRLLTDVYIVTQIAERSKTLAKKHELTTDDVIGELSKLVRSDLRQLLNKDGDLLPAGEWPDGIAGAISSLEIEALYDGQGKDRKQVGHTKKLKLWDKNAALEKAMKHLGLFEKNNSQLSDPIRQFLERCSGKGLPISNERD